MKKVFVACSSYETIPHEYYEEAKNVAKICAESEYDLVFGARTLGLMGEVYNEYLNHPNRNITAICMEPYKSDLELLPKEVETVLFNTNLEQIEYFLTCDKLVYLPGGYGTLAELMYLINAKANNLHSKDIIIVNSNHFYDRIIEHFNKLFEEHFTSSNNLYVEIKDVNDLKEVL